MSETEIYNRLNELSSYFSFGRVLGYIAFFETIGIDYQLQHGQDANKDRMISSELNFLTGLWIQNVVLNKKWDIRHDDDFTREVYKLMDDLHSLFLKKNDLANQFIEMFFYEGDLAYDWQYTYYAQKKYNTPCLHDVLKNDFDFDTNVLNSTLHKIKSCIEKQIKRRREEKWKHHKFISPMNAFTIKPNIIKKKFSLEEQSVIKALSFRLGSDIDKPISKITDFNSYVKYPIIELPNNRGCFCVNESAISIAMNETPFYWLQSSSYFGKNLGTIRGDIAEKLVLEIIQRRFQKNVFAHIPITKTKSSNMITDIDVFFCFRISFRWNYKMESMQPLAFYSIVNRQIFVKLPVTIFMVTCNRESCKHKMSPYLMRFSSNQMNFNQRYVLPGNNRNKLSIYRKKV